MATPPAERSLAQKLVAVAAGCILLAASLLKLWSDARYPPPPHPYWPGIPRISSSIASVEALVGLVLVAGFWPRRAWYATVSVFSLFVIITAVEAALGKDSCGCFGAVQVKPIYTMCLDIAAVAALAVSGRPSRGVRSCGLGVREEEGGSGSEVGGGGTAEGGSGLGVGGRKARLFLASVVAVLWVAAVAGMWLTRPVMAVTTMTVAGQEFGKPGELVVLEPEKWAGQKFSLAEHILADHIDIGSQLKSGQWIILLVHHDCEHCAAAVPRYVAAVERQKDEARGQNADAEPRLAVIEMPPFADAGDPPPWQLPSTVLSGRLDQSRDWFATTPVALLIKDGIVISGKDGDRAENPDRL